MDSIQNTAVYYCCISKGSRVLYAHSEGDHEIDNLATLCLEKAPPYHKWYFQTMGQKTFGFLMEDEYVYFAIADEGLGNPTILQFLERLRDKFKKAAKRGSGRTISSNQKSIESLQDQLVPVIHRLIASLVDHQQVVSEKSAEWPRETPSPHQAGSNDSNGQADQTGTSTKAPLLGKSSKQEKRKTKDHVIALREIGLLEEHRRSADRGMWVEQSGGTLSSSNAQNSLDSSISVPKDPGSMRIRPSNQLTTRNKWCRQVRIVLAIDAAICLILFVIWIVICQGTKCIS